MSTSPLEYISMEVAFQSYTPYVGFKNKYSTAFIYYNGKDLVEIVHRNNDLLRPGLGGMGELFKRPGQWDTQSIAYETAEKSLKDKVIEINNLTEKELVKIGILPSSIFGNSKENILAAKKKYLDLIIATLCLTRDGIQFTEKNNNNRVGGKRRSSHRKNQSHSPPQSPSERQSESQSPVYSAPLVSSSGRCNHRVPIIHLIHLSLFRRTTAAAATTIQCTE